MGSIRTDELRNDAVRIELTSGLSGKQIVDDLGVGKSTLNTWITAHRDTDTHLKANRTATSLLKKGALPRHFGRTKGGLNSKLHTICDSEGRPSALFLSAGQIIDYTGAAAHLCTMPVARALLAYRGYDTNWLRDALSNRKIAACIQSKSNRKVQIPHDRTLYRKRYKFENMLGKLKD